VVIEREPTDEVAADKSGPPRSMRVFTHPIIIAWWVSLLFIVPAWEWLDDLVLILVFTVVPFVVLALWLVGTPVWITGMTLVRVWQGRWPEVARCFAVLPLGAVIGFMGLKAGDFFAIKAYGPSLENALTSAKAGTFTPGTDRIFASSSIAFLPTGGFLDISIGIAYDESGLADRMMALAPSERTPDWQKNAVDVMVCKGNARHLFSNFYRISISAQDC